MSFFDRVTGNKTSKTELSVEDAKLVDPKFSAKSFFKLGFAKLGVICRVNLFMLLLVLPIVFTLFGIAGSFFGKQIADLTTTPTSHLYSHYNGISAYENSASLDVASTAHSIITTVNVDNVATIILKCIGLIVVFTFGPLNVGCAYVLRNTIKEKPVFPWHDFFYAIRKNLRQSIIFGIIDLIFLIAIPYSLMWYYTRAFTFSMKMLLFAMIIIALLYLIMRVYIYLMIVTFDLSFRKLFKNAFILSSAGIKRSFVMVIGVSVLLIISVYLYILLKSLGVLLPCIFTVAFGMYICYYCAYPVVKKYMIDPYYDNEGNPKEAQEQQSV
ncbi:MAG: hypothetical protein E7597_04715 [Ruminococcaceae bacterium]|nr:hypothetical protein [Oscillospiraceae bacterium]